MWPLYSEPFMLQYSICKGKMRNLLIAFPDFITRSLTDYDFRSSNICSKNVRVLLTYMPQSGYMNEVHR